VNTQNQLPKLYSLKVQSDSRGDLVSAEFSETDMKRFYYITATDKSGKRGLHAHKSLSQVFVPIIGSWKVDLYKDGKHQEFVLTSKQNYLFLPPGYWRELQSLEEFSVLGVMADDVFREEDYIRDIKDFREWEKLNDSVL
jgi:dTDP-4-dehydrorhamnose 3,5-epimerase-like enzyme